MTVCYNHFTCLNKVSKEEEQFIAETIKKLESQLGGLKEPIPWHVAHGRRRSEKQMRQIRNQRGEQIPEVEKALQALRSDGNMEINLIRDRDGEIVGFKI